MADIGLPVRGGSHASVMFDKITQEGAELVVKHQSNGRLLGRECRPLIVGSTEHEIKTHPDANQIICSLRTGHTTLDGTQFAVNCGESIKPTGSCFIVIGAMKAGTTTLFHLLAQHASMCQSYVELPGASYRKEINYFHKLYEKNHTARHYDWRFPFDPSRHVWTLDVSPNYAKLPMGKAVPTRIAALGGKRKLAYILRDPVDRIESHIAHTMRKTGKQPNLEACIQTSRYARHLDRFSAHIPRDDILLLDFGQLILDPTAVIERICNFLGIKHFTPRLEVHNTRGIDFQLSNNQRVELANSVRSDVCRLIEEYGFEPAKNWLQPRSHD